MQQHITHTVIALAAVLLLALPGLSPAADKTDHKRVRGLESARTLADGVQVIRGRISGHGTIKGKGKRVYQSEISPGDSPGCLTDEGNVTLAPTATLIMEIGGQLPCSEHDQVTVEQQLTINDATLRVILIDGYTPAAGQRFDILEWGSQSGAFATIDTSQAVLDPGLEWIFDDLYTTGELVVSGGAAGPEIATVPMPLWALAALATLLLSATRVLRIRRAR